MSMALTSIRELPLCGRWMESFSTFRAAFISMLGSTLIDHKVFIFGRHVEDGSETLPYTGLEDFRRRQSFWLIIIIIFFFVFFLR